MNANSDLKISVKSYGTDYVKESNTTDVRECLTSISGPTVAENTIITTNSQMYPEAKQIVDYENACEKRDIFSSRGYTGWE